MQEKFDIFLGGEDIKSSLRVVRTCGAKEQLNGSK